MSVLIKPLLTEKVAALNEQSTFGFVVDQDANKVEIKKEIESAYGVTVLSVNTMNYLGKSKTRYTKSKVISGRKPSFKKAIVKLAEGEIIDFYSGI